jgi:hypothetical protein
MLAVARWCAEEVGGGALYLISLNAIERRDFTYLTIVKLSNLRVPIWA